MRYLLAENALPRSDDIQHVHGQHMLVVLEHLFLPPLLCCFMDTSVHKVV